MLSDEPTATISDSDSTTSNHSFDREEEVALFKDHRQTPAHAPAALQIYHQAGLINAQPGHQMVIQVGPTEPDLPEDGRNGNVLDDEENRENMETEDGQETDQSKADSKDNSHPDAPEKVLTDEFISPEAAAEVVAEADRLEAEAAKHRAAAEAKAEADRLEAEAARLRAAAATESPPNIEKEAPETGSQPEKTNNTGLEGHQKRLPTDKPHTSTADTDRGQAKTNKRGRSSQQKTADRPSPPGKKAKSDRTKQVACRGYPIPLSGNDDDPEYVKPNEKTYLGYKSRSGRVYRMEVSRIGPKHCVRGILLKDHQLYLFHRTDICDDPGPPRVANTGKKTQETARRHETTRRDDHDGQREAAKAQARARAVATENADLIQSFKKTLADKHGRHYSRADKTRHTRQTLVPDPGNSDPLQLQGLTNATTGRPAARTTRQATAREPVTTPTRPVPSPDIIDIGSDTENQSHSSVEYDDYPDDHIPSSSDRARLTEAKTRQIEAKIRLVEERNRTDQLTAQNHVIMSLIKSTSNNLTEDQEDRKNNKQINMQYIDTEIEADNDDAYHNLTPARYLPASTDLHYAQVQVPDEFAPVRSNYALEEFGMTITKLAGIHKCHSRTDTTLQLKTFTDSNLRKVDTDKAWNRPDRSGNILTKPLEDKLKNVQDATLALLNFDNISTRICPNNFETRQLFNAVYRTQVAGYPVLNAHDIADLFTQWLLKRNGNISSGETIPYTWYEEKITSIVNKRNANLTEANVASRDAAARIAKYSDEPDTRRRNIRFDTPRGGNRNRNSNNKPNSRQPRRPTSTASPRTSRAAPTGPSTAGGQEIPCRDYNRDSGCSRSSGATCTKGNMMYVHRCNHKVAGGKYCLENHVYSEHK